MRIKKTNETPLWFHALLEMNTASKSRIAILLHALISTNELLN